MATIFVTKQNTLENFRVKSNTVFGAVGDLTDLTQDATVTYTGLSGNSNDSREADTDYSGTPAVFTVSRSGGEYTVDAITTAGTGYAINDEIVILGSTLGGEDGTNDVTITVTSVTGSFGIDGVTVAGTSISDIISELNGLRSEVGTATTALTTNANDLRDAINEIETVLRDGGDGIQNYSLNTDANDLIGAINELETAVRGTATDYNLDTTATDLVDAINEHESDLGSMSFNVQGSSANTDVTYVNIGSDVTAALNALKTKSDFHSDQIGGVMLDDYEGDDTNIISALNNLYSASSVSTLNDEYIRRDGVGPTTGVLQVEGYGITSNANNFLIKTGASDVTAVTISPTNQNVGIGGGVGVQKLKVTGGINATSGFYYNGDDTDTRYVRTDTGSDQTLSITTTVDGNITFAPNAGKSVVIGGSTVATNTLTYLEWFQDTVGDMFTSNSESGGIAGVYDDSTGKITLSIANNSHSHVNTNISNWDEAVQDTVGSMVGGNTENGLTVSYDDNSGKLNFDVNDPLLTISGEATGSATMTNLGDTTISITLSDEAIQDAAAAMLTSGTHTGISTTYDDANNKLNLALTKDPTITLTGDVSGEGTMVDLSNVSIAVTVADDSHNHITDNIDGLAEYIQDTIGTMLTGNTESGITVTYDDANNEIDFDVNDPLIKLVGDVTGQATMVNLSDIEITTTVSNDSHNHDGRYYTETEADNRFANVSGDTFTGNVTIQDSNLYVERDIYIGENSAGNSDMYFYDDDSNAWRGLRWADGTNDWEVEANDGNYYRLIHTGNQSSFTVSNATNASTLDGVDSTQFLRSDADDTATGTLTCSNIYTRSAGSYNIGESGTRWGTVYATTFNGTATSAQYADLAEKYLPDAEYTVGTVMRVGGEAEVTQSISGSKAIGVISHNPAFMMNRDLEGGVYVALKGRVPVKVVGPCSKGDELIPTSDGYAMSAGATYTGNKTFAVALEDKSGAEVKLVEAVIL
jgi:hypothetical protein